MSEIEPKFLDLYRDMFNHTWYIFDGKTWLKEEEIYGNPDEELLRAIISLVN